jgi:hypothetical protein
MPNELVIAGAALTAVGAVGFLAYPWVGLGPAKAPTGYTSVFEMVLAGDDDLGAWIGWYPQGWLWVFIAIAGVVLTLYGLVK